MSLRTVPTIVTAQAIVGTEILGFPLGSAHYYRNIFAQFKTMGENRI